MDPRKWTKYQGTLRSGPEPKYPKHNPCTPVWLDMKDADIEEWGGQKLQFTVVNADNLHNFLDDNHKSVLVTTVLTTRWQPCVLCVSRQLLNIILDRYWNAVSHVGEWWVAFFFWFNILYIKYPYGHMVLFKHGLNVEG